METIREQRRVPAQKQCLSSTALSSRSLDAAGRNMKQCECQIAATSCQGEVPGHRSEVKNEARERIDAAELRGSECRIPKEGRRRGVLARRDVPVPARVRGVA